MRSYADGKWLLHSDAQLTKTAAMVRELPDDWEWTWLLPPASQVAHGANTAPFVQEDAGHIVPREISWPDNVLQARYHWEAMEMRDVLAIERPDVILCEVPEHVPAYRVAMRMEGIDVPIVAMYEHVDIYAETDRGRVGHMLRQIEGALGADLCAFPLRGMIDSWCEAADRDGCGRHIPMKRALWPTIFSPREVESLIDRVPEDLDTLKGYSGPPVVLFAGRLSDNGRTHYEEFFQACCTLPEDAFCVWVCNPNESVAWEEVRHMCPQYEEHPFGEKTLEREEYLRLLWMADVVPVLYPMSHIYSVGFLEAITADCLIVTQQPPMGYEDQVEAAVKISSVTVSSVASGIRRAVEASTHGQVQMQEAQREWAMAERSVERNVQYVREDIERLAAGRGGE